MESGSERQELVQEIQRRIQNLINTENLTDEQKLAIARRALGIIEKAQERKAVQ